ncbi:MAG: REP-associated tyrosine transposase [Hyphomicrobiaceae bacterium]
MRYRRVKAAGATYFFTLVTERRLHIFRDAAVVATFEQAVAAVRSRHPFEVDASVILLDHLHMLWTLPDGDADFSTRWRLIKAKFTRAYLWTREAPHRSVSRQSKGEQAIWQRRFWEHAIRDDEDFSAHLDYIHLNPVHHGLAATPSDWPHSTFRTWVERGVYEPNWGSDAKPELPEWARKHE